MRQAGRIKVNKIGQAGNIGQGQPVAHRIPLLDSSPHKILALDGGQSERLLFAPINCKLARKAVSCDLTTLPSGVLSLSIPYARRPETMIAKPFHLAPNDGNRLKQGPIKRRGKASEIGSSQVPGVAVDNHCSLGQRAEFRPADLIRQIDKRDRPSIRPLRLCAPLLRSHDRSPSLSAAGRWSGAHRWVPRH